jgi:hypothetical protein
MKVIKLDVIIQQNEFLKGYRMFRFQNLYWLLLRDQTSAWCYLALRQNHNEYFAKIF